MPFLYPVPRGGICGSTTLKRVFRHFFRQAVQRERRLIRGYFSGRRTGTATAPHPSFGKDPGQTETYTSL